MGLDPNLRLNILDSAKNITINDLKKLNPKELKVLNLLLNNKPISENQVTIASTLKNRFEAIKQEKPSLIHSTSKKIAETLHPQIQQWKSPKGLKGVETKDLQQTKQRLEDLAKELKGKKIDVSQMNKQEISSLIEPLRPQLKEIANLLGQTFVHFEDASPLPADENLIGNKLRDELNTFGNNLTNLRDYMHGRHIDLANLSTKEQNEVFRKMMNPGFKPQDLKTKDQGSGSDLTI